MIPEPAMVVACIKARVKFCRENLNASFDTPLDKGPVTLKDLINKVTVYMDKLKAKRPVISNNDTDLVVHG